MAIRNIVTEGDEILRKKMQRNRRNYRSHQNHDGGYAGNYASAERCGIAGPQVGGDAQNVYCRA